MVLADIVFIFILFTLSYITFLHLILWFENRDSFGKKRLTGKNLQSVSILVPAYNEEKNIEKLIKNLLNINYPKNKTEIIVIDDGSSDNTYKIAKKYESKNFKVVRKKNEGKATTLNFGITRAKSKYIAVIDADSVIDKSALKTCMEYFDEENVAAVTSHILVKKKSSIWERLTNVELMVIALMRKAQERLNVVSATPGPLSVYRKEVLVKVGGFDKNVLVEDVEIAWRLLEKGYRIRMAFDALAYSLFPDNVKNWWRQRTRWNVGGIQTLVRYFGSLFKPGSFEVGRFLVPVSFVGYSLSLLGISLFMFLFLTNVINYASFIIASFQIGINPFARFEFTYLIDFKIVYGLFMFLLSVFVLRLALGVHKEKVGLMNLIFFITLYSILFPANTLYSMYKFMKGEKEWLTK